LHCVLEGASIAIEEVSHVSRRSNQLSGRSCLRIFDVDQSGADSLPILAFWTYNITILIHLIQSDPGLLSVCEQRGLLEMLREMLNSMQGE
jgi:hypothetical protein